MKNKTRFKLVLVAIITAATNYTTHAQPNYPTKPEQAQLIYSDVENFIEAFELLKNRTDTIAVLNQYYFDRGSAGLKEFIVKQNLTPEKLKDAIAKSPDSYAKITGFLTKKDAFAPQFSDLMQGFGEVLPKAMYPPTYMLVGANRGVAQASKAGQLVTVTRVVDNDKKLKQLIVHELAHFQQAITMGIQKYGALYATQNNMLAFCLREGGAEFITSLVLNEITQSKSLEYLKNNESALKSRFMADLANQDAKYWLWESLDDPNAPKLLGYVMGYKICDAYYKKATNKQAALTTILMMELPEDFLERSGYFKE